MEIKTLSIFEKVDFPQFGINSVSAKVDSGAFTGALHCTQVKEIKTKEGLVLEFSPFDFPETVIRTDKFKVREVKSSNGETEQRYFINTFVSINGETYKVELSLADRSNMKWPVIIGRKFLRKHNFLVDVNKKSKVMLAKKKVQKI
jgi:hypothetical protein